jgi:hypothetical protein
MNRAGAILAARKGQADPFAAAWSGLIERLGGWYSDEESDPLLAVFSTPEQAMLACMTLLESSPAPIRGLGGLGLHMDQLSPNGRAPSFTGRAIAVALSEQADPRTACLSLAMTNALAAKPEMEFGPVENLPQADTEPALSFVRMRGLDAGQATAADPEPAFAASDAASDPDDLTVIGPRSDARAAPGDEDLDATVVAPTARREERPPPRDRIVALTRAISEYETCAVRHLEEGPFQPGIEALDQAIHLAGELAVTAAARARLTARRAALIEAVKVTGPAVLEIAACPFILLPRDVLSIGRPASTGEAPDIALSCRRVSRVEAGPRLIRSRHGLRIEHRGGANSVFVDETLLEPGHGSDLDLLNRCVTLSLGGPGDPPSPGDCRLRLQAFGSDRSVVRCRVDLGHLGGHVSGDLERDWPAWREDSSKVWILFSDRVDIGDSAEAPVTIGAADPVQAGTIQARLRYDDGSGYVLEPTAGEITIDGYETGANAPLRDRSEIRIGSTVMTFRRARDG